MMNSLVKTYTNEPCEKCYSYVDKNNNNIYYVLFNDIDYYINNPTKALSIYTDRKDPLLILAFKINCLLLITKLLNTPKYNIWNTDDMGETFLDKIKNNYDSLIIFECNTKIFDILCTRPGVMLHNFVPDEYLKKPYINYKYNGPNFLSLLVFSQYFNEDIENNYECILETLCCNKNRYTPENEHIFNDIFSKILDNIPNNSLNNSFLRLCETNMTNFIIECVKRTKVNFKYTNKDKYNALIYAARNNNIKIVTLLLTYGIDPDQTNIYGEYPIFYAIKYNNIPMVSIIQSYSNNHNITYINKLTPYEYAFSLGRKNLLPYLVQSKKPTKINTNITTNNNSIKCHICESLHDDNLYLSPCGHGPFCSNCVHSIVNNKCPYCYVTFTSTLKICSIN